ncbi:hypothetical protein C5C90_07080 [Rathayibacter sp. AY1D4]|uniref:hypothetical protein n=1 Tax=Rathayibacter sp. AY1D4 TaxID=2080545 RepID=UPI000CE86E59|nr:hypothetical protein [Rathayibacter sp. AY1D4]PPH75684.1 hypothetical protein C5C90_07080 [Rathayibacter sp. AY1D4]
MHPEFLHRGSTERSSPIGVHAGLLVGDWTPESGRRAIGAAASIGFDLIEIPAPDDPDASAWTPIGDERSVLPRCRNSGCIRRPSRP